MHYVLRVACCYTDSFEDIDLNDHIDLRDLSLEHPEAPVTGGTHTPALERSRGAYVVRQPQ